MKQTKYRMCNIERKFVRVTANPLKLQEAIKYIVSEHGNIINGTFN